jgi:hypothetical protein
MDFPLFPGSRPRRLLAIIHEPPNLLTAVSRLFRNQSESELLYDWRFTAIKFFLAAIPLRLTASNFIFQLNTCGYSPHVTSSRLELLVVLTSAVILRPETHGIHDHILLSQIRDSHNLEGQVPVYTSPGTGLPGYTPRYWVPFVFSYDSQSQSQSQSCD